LLDVDYATNEKTRMCRTLDMPPLYFTTRIELEKNADVTLQRSEKIRTFMAECIPNAEQDSIDIICLVVNDDVEIARESCDTIAELIHVRIQLLLLGRFQEKFPESFSTHIVRHA
jgi:hypothetical protein